MSDDEWETWLTPAQEGCGLFVFLMAWALFLALAVALTM